MAKPKIRKFGTPLILFQYLGYKIYIWSKKISPEAILLVMSSTCHYLHFQPFRDGTNGGHEKMWKELLELRKQCPCWHGFQQSLCCILGHNSILRSIGFQRASLRRRQWLEGVLLSEEERQPLWLPSFCDGKKGLLVSARNTRLEYFKNTVKNYFQKS